MLRTLLRWISRFFLFGLIAAAVGFVITKLMGQDDEEFEDFEDLDSSFEFEETPVEIDVSAGEISGPSMASDTASQGTTTMRVEAAEAGTEEPGSSEGRSGMSAPDFQTISGPRLIDINGIGPVYEAKLHAIGIHNMNDLASADPNTIAERLEVKGGAAQVTEWIAQAQSMRSQS
jgi:predicted flap endonuclease-1-like 5' DNA nuclease